MLNEELLKRNISANINHLLEDRGMSQSDLSRAAKVERMAISRIARGVNMATTTILASIAQALEVTVDALLSDPPRKNSRKAS